MQKMEWMKKGIIERKKKKLRISSIECCLENTERREIWCGSHTERIGNPLFWCCCCWWWWKNCITASIEIGDSWLNKFSEFHFHESMRMCKCVCMWYLQFSLAVFFFFWQLSSSEVRNRDIENGTGQPTTDSPDPFEE